MTSSTLLGRDIRALGIFGSYLLTCFSLTVLICRDLYRRYLSSTLDKRRSQSRSKPFGPAAILFTALAAICLGTTWYYMLSFFNHSYIEWARDNLFLANKQSIDTSGFTSWIASKHLGDWLKDVQLFQDAWGTALRKPQCLFWAQPIFFVTAAWSIYISTSGESSKAEPYGLGFIANDCIPIQARERAIPHAWAYMLLGQIVAISFAQNLFFIAVLLHRPTSSSKRPSSSSIDDIVHIAVPVLTIPAVALIPLFVNGPNFLSLLLLPHLALMLPPLHAAFSAARTQNVRSVATAYIALLVASTLLQIKVATIDMAGRTLGSFLRHPSQLSEFVTRAHGLLLWDSLQAAFFSHPAVSSVGFDVILSLTTGVIWLLFGRGQAANAEAHEKEL